MERQIEIFFEDLKEEVRKAILDEFKTTAEAENWDVFSIAVIVRDMQD